MGNLATCVELTLLVKEFNLERVSSQNEVSVIRDELRRLRMQCAVCSSATLLDGHPCKRAVAQLPPDHIIGHIIQATTATIDPNYA